MIGFLPLILLGVFSLARTRSGWTIAWLAVASVGFYAGWSPAYVPLLLASVAGNYLAGRQISIAAAAHRSRRASMLLTVAVAANLPLLGYYKYAGFFSDALGALVGFDAHFGAIELPLGISFFTFTHIAFLVDARRGLTAELAPLRYGLFVTYFPHLIAGPILHHREMMRQFETPGIFRFDATNFAAGIALFVIGLSKKVPIADQLAPFGDAVFASALGVDLTIAEAWVGALAYTLQIYFDFSGYSDMALGLSLMIGVQDPASGLKPPRQ